MDIKSLFSLAYNNNNGFFKSEKQASFLFSKAIDGSITIAQSFYNNTYLFHFILDESGIVEILKETSKQTTIHWTRNPDHEDFLNKNEALANEKEEKKQKAERFNKLCSIINKYNINNTSRVIGMLSGKSDQEMLNIMLIIQKHDNIVKSLEKERDQLINQI